MSLHDNLDLATPPDRLMFQATGAIAEFERALVQESAGKVADVQAKGKTPELPPGAWHPWFLFGSRSGNNTALLIAAALCWLLSFQLSLDPRLANPLVVAHSGQLRMVADLFSALAEVVSRRSTNETLPPVRSYRELLANLSSRSGTTRRT